MMKLFIATLLTCALGFPLKDHTGFRKSAAKEILLETDDDQKADQNDPTSPNLLAEDKNASTTQTRTTQTHRRRPSGVTDEDEQKAINTAFLQRPYEKDSSYANRLARQQINAEKEREEEKPHRLPRQQFVESSETGEQVSFLRLHGNLDADSYEVQSVTAGGKQVRILLVTSEAGCAAARDAGIIDDDDYATCARQCETVDEDLIIIDLDAVDIDSLVQYKEYIHRQAGGHDEAQSILETFTRAVLNGEKIQERVIIDKSYSKTIEKEYKSGSDLVTLTMNAEAALGASIYCKYEVLYKAGIPYGVTVHGVGARARLDLMTRLNLLATKEYTKTITGPSWDIANPQIVNTVFFIGVLPVQIQMSVPISAGTGDLVFTISGKFEVTQENTIKARYDALCHRKRGCLEVASSLSKTIGTPVIDAEVKVSVGIEPYFQVGLRVGLYFDAVWGQISIKAALPVEATGAISNAEECPGLKLGFTVDLNLDLVLSAGSEIVSGTLERLWPLWSIGLVDLEYCPFLPSLGSNDNVDGKTTQTQDVYRLARKEDVCPGTDIIASQSDCELAAGKITGGNWDGQRTWSDRVYGCLYTVGDGDINWNSYGSGSANNDGQVSLCEQGPTEPVYKQISRGSPYCEGGMLSNAQSGGQIDCEKKCSDNDKCKFYSLWSTGWCRLTSDCDNKITTADSIKYKWDIVIMKLEAQAQVTNKRTCKMYECPAGANRINEASPSMSKANCCQETCASFTACPAGWEKQNLASTQLSQTNCCTDHKLGDHARCGENDDCRKDHCARNGARYHNSDWDNWYCCTSGYYWYLARAYCNEEW